MINNNIKKVVYKEFYQNVYNKDWSGWKNLGEVISEIEAQGSVSKKHKDSKVLHAIEFLNAHLQEERIKEVYHLEYLDGTHNYLYARRGDAIPDFKDCNNLTYELKSRWNLEDATKCNWYNADVCLFYWKNDNSLYKYDRVNKKFHLIKENFRMPFINTKTYPYTDEMLGI